MENSQEICNLKVTKEIKQELKRIAAKRGIYIQTLTHEILSNYLRQSKNEDNEKPLDLND